MLSVSIIGAGPVGRSLAIALHKGGSSPKAIFSKRSGSASSLARSSGSAIHGRVHEFQPISKIVIIAVPDDEIAGIAERISRVNHSLKGTIFLHTSGARSSDELLPLKRRGASIGSLHPLQTFSRKKVRTEMKGIYCAVEGDRAAVRAARSVVRTIGARHFSIRKHEKIVYHIAAVFASNYVVTLISAAEQLGKKISIPEKDLRKALAPIIRQTVENVLNTSPAEALTGPIKRGDTATVQRHLQALASSVSLKQFLPLYAVLGLETARLSKRRI